MAINTTITRIVELKKAVKAFKQDYLNAMVLLVSNSSLSSRVHTDSSNVAIRIPRDSSGIGRIGLYGHISCKTYIKYLTGNYQFH